MTTTEMQAILEGLILNTLRTEKMHGYDIALLIHQSGSDLLEIADGRLIQRSIEWRCVV